MVRATAAGLRLMDLDFGRGLPIRNLPHELTSYGNIRQHCDQLGMFAAKKTHRIATLIQL